MGDISGVVVVLEDFNLISNDTRRGGLAPKVMQMVRRPMFVLRSWFNVSDIVLSRVGATRSSLSRIRDTQIQKSSTSDRIALVRCVYCNLNILKPIPIRRFREGLIWRGLQRVS